MFRGGHIPAGADMDSGVEVISLGRDGRRIFGIRLVLEWLGRIVLCNTLAPRVSADSAHLQMDTIGDMRAGPPG